MRARSARVSITSQLMRGAVDNVIHGSPSITPQRGAVAGDAYHQAGEILRALLRCGSVCALTTLSWICCSFRLVKACKKSASLLSRSLRSGSPG